MRNEEVERGFRFFAERCGIERVAVELHDDRERNDDGPLVRGDKRRDLSARRKEDVGVDDEDGVARHDAQERTSGGRLAWRSGLGFP